MTSPSSSSAHVHVCLMALLVCGALFALNHPPNQTAPAAADASYSVAVVDIPVVLKEYKSLQRNVEKLNSDVRNSAATLKRQSNELRDALIRAGSLAHAAPGRNRLEEELESRLAQLNLQQQRQWKEFRIRESRIYDDARRNIETAIAACAKEYGINLVLRHQSRPPDPDDLISVKEALSRPVVLFHDAADITPEIIERLNQHEMDAP